MTEMMDRLVRLYALPNFEGYAKRLAEQNVQIRRPRSYEKFQVVEWVRETFSTGWAGECDVTFTNHPVTTFLATVDGEIVGFCCYEATYRNFLGPLGVAPAYRCRKIGSALLVRSLHAMAELGYAYAIIGGPRDAAALYAKEVGATDIAGSQVGIYLDRLRGRDS